MARPTSLAGILGKAEVPRGTKLQPKQGQDTQLWSCQPPIHVALGTSFPLWASVLSFVKAGCVRIRTLGGLEEVYDIVCVCACFYSGWVCVPVCVHHTCLGTFP